MTTGTLTIGELAAKLGLRVETIRYYEKVGLVPAPERSPGNHRVYTAEHLAQLAFIQCAREYDFSLKDIGLLLGGFRGAAPSCSEVKAVTDAHLARIRDKIARLKSLEASLAELSSRCRADQSKQCIIIETLGGPIPENV